MLEGRRPPRLQGWGGKRPCCPPPLFPGLCTAIIAVYSTVCALNVPEVISGHERSPAVFPQFWYFLWRQARVMQSPKMCSGRRYTVRLICNMTFSAQDLDLKSKFQHDILRSNYSPFDASWQEGKRCSQNECRALLSQKLIHNFFFAKTAIFSYRSLEAKPWS